MTARRDGQTIWYSIASGPAREILKTLYRVYCAPQPICEPEAVELVPARGKKKRIKNDDRPQPPARSHASRRS